MASYNNMYASFNFSSNDAWDENMWLPCYSGNQRRKSSNKKKSPQHIKKDIYDLYNESKSCNHKYTVGVNVVVSDTDNEYYLYCGTIAKLLRSVYDKHEKIVDEPLYEVEFLSSFGFNDVNKPDATEKQIFRESQLLLFSDVDLDVLDSETKRCQELAEQFDATKQDVLELRNKIDNICNAISTPYTPLGVTSDGDLSVVRNDIDTITGQITVAKSDVSMIDDRVTCVDDRVKNLETKAVDIEFKVIDIERKHKKASKLAKLAFLGKFF